MTTWMDQEDIMLSKISHIEKDKYCLISLICEIKNDQNNWTNKTKHKQIYIYRKQIDVARVGWCGGMDEKVGGGIRNTNCHLYNTYAMGM